MKKIFLLYLLFQLTSCLVPAQTGVKICNMPQTNSGSVNDYIIKQDSDCTGGVTQKMKIQDFIDTYLGGGGGTPASPVNSLQYNDSGSFGAIKVSYSESSNDEYLTADTLETLVLRNHEQDQVFSISPTAIGLLGTTILNTTLSGQYLFYGGGNFDTLDFSATTAPRKYSFPNFNATLLPTPTLPSSGLFLTNNGVVSSWANPLPTISIATNGLFLTNNGASASWGQVLPTMSVASAGKYLTNSGGVALWDNPLPAQALPDAGKFLKTNGTSASWATPGDYSEASVLLTQSGTSNPVMTIEYDHVGIDSIVRLSAGVYDFYSNNKFTLTKTYILPGIINAAFTGIETGVVGNQVNAHPEKYRIHSQILRIDMDDGGIPPNYGTPTTYANDEDDVLHGTRIILRVLN